MSRIRSTQNVHTLTESDFKSFKNIFSDWKFFKFLVLFGKIIISNVTLPYFQSRNRSIVFNHGLFSFTVHVVSIKHFEYILHVQYCDCTL